MWAAVCVAVHFERSFRRNRRGDDFYRFRPRGYLVPLVELGPEAAIADRLERDSGNAGTFEDTFGTLRDYLFTSDGPRKVFSSWDATTVQNQRRHLPGSHAAPIRPGWHIARSHYQRRRLRNVGVVTGMRLVVDGAARFSLRLKCRGPFNTEELGTSEFCRRVASCNVPSKEEGF